MYVHYFYIGIAATLIVEAWALALARFIIQLIRAWRGPHGKH